MTRLAGGVLLSLVCSVPAAGQDRDRSLERLALALRQPPPIVSGVSPVAPSEPKTRGIFTLVPPDGQGEMVRVSVPVGKLVSQAFRNVAAANKRRREDAARRQVQADLKRFIERQPSP